MNREEALTARLLPRPLVFNGWPQVRRIAVPLAAALCALLVWELACRVFQVSKVTAPAPSDVIGVLYRGSDVILPHAIATLREVVIGFVCATTLGLALALLITLYRPVKEAVFPNLVVLQFIPKIALAPLFIVWFGIETESRVAFATFMGFFPVMISTIAGLSAAPPHLVRYAHSLRATHWQVFTTIRVPAALPYIFSSSKIAVSLSVIGIVVGEFITSQRGLGYLVLFASSKADTSLMFASVACLSAGGMALFGVVTAIEKLALRKYCSF
ncbi:ABC transporter permease [Bordetella sp. BOR01]|uniref:ABC transporter permease n=1 Tax=Bordetella sp. BOR01 TaxID=2854779 RepID=UPI001C4597F8|nr:ABC transporter permease [Bordetella sp. BOR01]MBV7481681.1 ABC transporter permease [Bordetella sp. BOR01]